MRRKGRKSKALKEERREGRKEGIIYRRREKRGRGKKGNIEKKSDLERNGWTGSE